MSTLENLEARIQRLEDIKQIERLQRIYGYYRDYGEWEKIVDLFSDNAESVEVADHGVYKGKEGVRRFYIDLIKGGKDRKPRPGVLSICMQMQGVITVEPDGKTAKGRWYGYMIEARPTMSLHEGELRQLWGHGIYENEYVKEDGKWKIKKLHFFLNFCTPYEDGWLKTPVVGHHGPDPIVKPDAPPTTWYPYPSGYHFQPHYKHPITGK
jgi:hypothetical protein